MPEEQPFIPPGPLHTAVLFLIYKRPDTTKQVFEAIRRAKPPRLYVAADGPKPDVPGEAEKVQQVRDIVLNGVDWDCEVKTLFRDKNLGCKYGVSGGITWFFEHEEEGIILEDDTLPSQSFFWFCQELLVYYKNDSRVMTISGDNFQNRQRTTYSYYFSRYMHCWGWASWRRAWKYFDLNMSLWPEIKDEKWLYDILENKKEIKQRKRYFNSVYIRQVDSWARIWTLNIWSQSGLNILPNVNLVANLGFGIDATHTNCRSDNNFKRMNNINLPVKHPPFVIRDKYADEYTSKFHFGNLPSWRRILKKIKRIGNL